MKVFIWAILSLILLDISYTLINAPSTIANIIGVTLIFIGIMISIKTRCFTQFKNKKDE